MIINPDIKKRNLILKAIERNKGYCPCDQGDTPKEDIKCPCKKFREEKICCCNLYVMKTKLVNEVINKIVDWELDNGEDFLDCHGDQIFPNLSFLCGYWSVKFPELYQFLMERTSNKIPWKYLHDGLLELIEEFYDLDWNENNANEVYRMTLLPFAQIIIDNPIYMGRFNKTFEEYGE